MDLPVFSPACLPDLVLWGSCVKTVIKWSTLENYGSTQWSLHGKFDCGQDLNSTDKSKSEEASTGGSCFPTIFPSLPPSAWCSSPIIFLHTTLRPLLLTSTVWPDALAPVGDLWDLPVVGNSPALHCLVLRCYETIEMCDAWLHLCLVLFLYLIMTLINVSRRRRRT